MRCGYLPLARLGTVGWALVLSGMPAAVAAESATESPATSAPAAKAGADVEVAWPAIVAAVDRHPSVTAGQHELYAARAEVDAAAAAPNPNLEATTGYGRARDGSESRVEWGVGLTIPLGWLAQRRARVDAARAHANAVAAETDALRREVLVELHQRFWGLIYAQERVAALTELNQQTATLAGTVRRRVEAGESRPVEAARVDVEEERVASELAGARSVLDAQRRQLSLWLKAPAGRTPVAVADLSRLPRPMTAGVAQARARAQHPAVAAANARVQALEADVSAERRARVPGFSVGVFADNELDRAAYGVRLSVDLPIWNWNSGNIRRAESALAAGRKRLEAQRLEVESAAIELQSSCEASVALAARYRDKMRPRAAEAARSIERSYEIGESTLLEVIDARRTFLETRTEYLIALARAQNDCSRLAVLLGEELP